MESILQILNLVLIEGLLSVDNAAVLAILASTLPLEQRKKALWYGLVGAYVFRGVFLFLIKWLTSILVLKLIGGGILLGIALKYFLSKQTEETDDHMNAENHWVYKIIVKIFKKANPQTVRFWAVVAVIEFMDIAFSVDNVFAATALSNNYWIIFSGVCIGIATMRFASGMFTVIIEKYPKLLPYIFVIIGLLGIKLALSYFHLFSFLETEQANMYSSIITLILFLIPILTKKQAGIQEEAAVFTGSLLTHEYKKICYLNCHLTSQSLHLCFLRR